MPRGAVRGGLSKNGCGSAAGEGADTEAVAGYVGARSRLRRDTEWVEDPIQRAMSIPGDQELLPALGRVTWAAIRLHHGVRDALGHIFEPSDEYFEGTLGGAVSRLQDAAQRVAEPHRTELIGWCETVGRPAAKKRNGVMHSIAYTDAHGRQALRGTGPDRPDRYLEADLLTIAGELDLASLALPPGPYVLQPCP
jgi:hypothetical protein